MGHLREPIYHQKNGIPTFFVLGRPKTKSIEMSTQGVEGIGREYKDHGVGL